MKLPVPSRRSGIWPSVAFFVSTLPLLAACGGVSPQEPTPEVIFTGRFITLDSALPEVEALAVAGGRIVGAGSRSDVEPMAGASTRRIEIPGIAVPGFIDAHVHPSGVGRLLDRLNLRGLTKEQILEQVATTAASTPAGQWIFGSGWDEGFFLPVAFPTAADLDAVSPNHPVILSRIDGHSSWVNSRVMELAGISESTLDPDGGRIVRNTANQPTGMLIDNAQGLVRRVTPSIESAADGERGIRSALQQYARWGLTSFHDAGSGLETIAIYKKLLESGELPVRVYAMAEGDTAVRRYLAQGPEIDLGDGLLSIRSFKVLLDGALGSRGALLTDPYTDEPSEHGLQLLDESELDSLVQAARENGFQVNAHAIGDRAVMT